MTETTDTPAPSPTVAWADAIDAALNAARRAGAALTEALRNCPRPVSAEDTAALLRFRSRCGISPISYPFRQLGRFRPAPGEPDTAERLCLSIGIDPASIRGPLESLLETIERLLDQRARQGDGGLLHTDGLHCRVEDSASETNPPDALCRLDSIPAEHPIRAMIPAPYQGVWHGKALPTVVLGPAAREGGYWTSRDWYGVVYAVQATEHERVRQLRREAVQEESGRQNAEAIERDRLREQARRADPQETIRFLEQRIQTLTMNR